MQMRNLLRLMGSLALTAGAATSVVACGEQAAVNLNTVLKKLQLGEIAVVDTTKPTEQELKNGIKAVPENKDINLSGIKVQAISEESNPIVSAKVTPDGKVYNGDEIIVTFTLVAKKADNEITNDIKTALESKVDGSSLTTAQTQKDAATVITTAMKTVTDGDHVGEATFTFVNPDDALTVGDNDVNIKVTFGESKDVAVKVKLTGVTAAPKTDAEVIADIKTALEKEVDGSSLNTEQTQKDAETVIAAAIKKVIDNDKANGTATIKFTNGGDKLTAGANKVAITVTFGTSKDVAMTVNLTKVAAA